MDNVSPIISDITKRKIPGGNNPSRPWFKQAEQYQLHWNELVASLFQRLR